MFFRTTPSVSVTEAYAAAGKPGTEIIDVRTHPEYTSGHAAGARNIPLDTIGGSDMQTLQKSDTVYVICQSGGRSVLAVQQLKQAGVNAVNVSGGTLAWRKAGLPMK